MNARPQSGWHGHPDQDALTSGKPLWMTETGKRAAHTDEEATAEQVIYVRHVIEAMLVRPWHEHEHEHDHAHEHEHDHAHAHEYEYEYEYEHEYEVFKQGDGPCVGQRA